MRATKSDTPVVPVISTGPYWFQHVNAAEQRRDPHSMLNWTERIIRMRKEVPEIGWGDFDVLDTGDNAVLGIRYDWRNNSVLFLHNLASEPREVTFAINSKSDSAKLLVNLLGGDHSTAARNGRHSVCLDAYGYAGTESAGWIICSSAASSEHRRLLPAAPIREYAGAARVRPPT